MSATGDEEKESQKALPLDLARNQIAATVRTVDGKSPLVMTSQALRGMRVLTQAVPSANSTIIAANLLPQAVLKQGGGDPSRAAQISTIINTQASNIRPTQITLSTAPIVTNLPGTGTSYHVPRGPAVVANLAAPRSNVTTVRTPMVVSAQTGHPHTFVRPPRTPSPAQNTAWLTTNSSNGSQIKGAPTVLSSPVRGATVTGKQILSRPQVGPQTVSTIRPGTILQNAITIGQSAQLHSFKPGVTIAQVLPARTQAVVYSANTTTQFSPARLTVTNNSVQSQQRQQPTVGRPISQLSATRLAVPASVTQSAGPRLVAPQATVLATGARISTPQAPTRIATQPSVTIGRLAATPTQVSSTNLLGQTRISTLSLHSLAKVISQPTQGTIHLTSLATPIKTPPTIVTTAAATPPPTRTINVPPTAIVTTQRQATVVPSQAVSIAKVYPQPDNQSAGAANVFIHTPTVTTAPRRSSPSPTNISQTTGTAATTTVTTYSLAAGTYYYDYDAANNYSAVPRTTFAPQQQTSFAAAISQPRPTQQVHGMVANQQMRFNSTVMLVDQSAKHYSESESQQSLPTKVASSPRPSILRKRDHEGSPLKAAKNLTTVLTNLPPTPQPLISPPSRPDSRGNGHSSGGSTTISATSSPGLAEVNEDSMPHAPIKEEQELETTKLPPPPPMEMSPRKKPRKQQLTGNDLDEHNDDMQFISESTMKKEDSDGNQSDEPRDGAPEAGQVSTVRKPASASLLNSYRQTWKATHNHYLRYSDVRPKDERRPSIMDLANQYRVQDKVNGWKIHHLSTQMDDLADQEQTVYNQLSELLKCTESQDSSSTKFDDLNRINELIKGNLQRIKIINDGMVDAKTQIMKIFDHKIHVTDIISRCASKRNFKKREKS